MLGVQIAWMYCDEDKLMCISKRTFQLFSAISSLVGLLGQMSMIS